MTIKFINRILTGDFDPTLVLPMLILVLAIFVIPILRRYQIFKKEIGVLGYILAAIIVIASIYILFLVIQWQNNSYVD